MEIRKISKAQRISIADGSRCRRELYPILFSARSFPEPPFKISLKRDNSASFIHLRKSSEKQAVTVIDCDLGGEAVEGLLNPYPKIDLNEKRRQFNTGFKSL